MIRSRIIGTGHHLPERILTNHDLEQFMDTSDEWIQQRTGIAQRHIAEDGQGASDLGYPAAKKAIEAAGVEPGDIDLVICCTTTPDYLFPATACLIQDKLGCRRAGAYDVSAACSGFVYGLATADAFIRAGLHKTILLIGTERVANRLNWKRRDTAVLFGDGAGAVVLRAEEGDRGVQKTYLGADGGCGDILIMMTGGSRQPFEDNTQEEDQLAIHMNGQELFKKAVGAFGMAVEKALDGTGVTPADLDLFIPHQANTRIIYTAADRLGLDRDKVYINIDQVGNTTAASIPLALDQAVQQGRLKDGDNLMLAAFGAGLTWGGALVRW